MWFRTIYLKNNHKKILSRWINFLITFFSENTSKISATQANILPIFTTPAPPQRVVRSRTGDKSSAPYGRVAPKRVKHKGSTHEVRFAAARNGGSESLAAGRRAYYVRPAG